MYFFYLSQIYPEKHDSEKKGGPNYILNHSHTCHTPFKQLDYSMHIIKFNLFSQFLLKFCKKTLILLYFRYLNSITCNICGVSQKKPTYKRIFPKKYSWLHMVNTEKGIPFCTQI